MKSFPKPENGKLRVVIEGVQPEIDAGRFPAKRIVGDEVVVEANIFGDGHDHVAARLLYRKAGAKGWSEAPMRPIGNDRWSGIFPVTEQGRYLYTLVAGIDHFDTWRSGFEKKLAAGQDIAVELLNGALLVEQAAGRAKGAHAAQLKNWAAALGGAGKKPDKKGKKSKQQTAEALPPRVEDATEVALSPSLAELMARYPDTKLEARYRRELEIVVDRQRARYSTWYELFPRSAAGKPGVHGTFRDVEAQLDYVQDLGFDVLYMPPIHPIGRSFRKGKNNSVTAEPGDVGSPWAIGADEGGHTDILPELGTLEDFQHLRANAEARGIELALDIAFQCAPDHPWVKEHPDWFKKRADGTIQYAENPPKKYQDIYPIDFESKDWEALWDALRDVFLYWAGQGVRIFRVDNPHTKAFAFWEWAIASIKDKYPDALFLSEAFTRPRVMEQLAKLGFSQSYSYYCWRTTKDDIESFVKELTQTGLIDYFRPNFWPNTPDILPFNLQTGGRASFALRFVLAATLNGNYGIYGAAYELLDDVPFGPGREEYLNSEKYELKQWDRESPTSLAPLIKAVNLARRENPAFQAMDASLHFHSINNPQLICFSKRSADGLNNMLTIVNLDPFQPQAGYVYLWMAKLGLTDDSTYMVEDLLNGQAYQWRGPSNYVALDPAITPAHVFRVTAI